MVASLKTYFEPAALSPFEQDQRKRTLSVVLWFAMAGTFALALVNLSLNALPETIVLFGSSASCLVAIVLNNRGHYVLASSIATVVVLVAIDYNLYEGNGIHDPGIIAVPGFVMFGTLLFGRRSLPYFLFAAIASVVGLGALEMAHVIQTRFGASVADITVSSILTLTSGLVVWVVMGNLERNLERARQSEREMRAAYDGTLEGWAKALEYRDQETEGHTRRVANICVQLAREWGLSQPELDDIYRGALLHDIGKVAIPDRILFKPGPLSPGEWKVMKRHASVGRQMLAGIPYLRSALTIPSVHHERWDGTGYPEGLRGAEIPIQARIFAVVDEYDALGSKRPYRKAWPQKKILAYIKENAGKVFDPNVATVFLRMHEEGAFERHL